MENRVRLVGTLLAVVGALSLAGCASPTAIEDFSGLPQVPVAQAAGAEEEAGAELEDLEVDEGETVVVYLDYGDRLALVTWGSSTCPVVGSDIVVTEDQHSGNSVRIETVPIPDDAVCTMDFVPHTTIFGTPENTTTTQPLNVDVNGEEIVVPVK